MFRFLFAATSFHHLSADFHWSYMFVPLLCVYAYVCVRVFHICVYYAGEIDRWQHPGDERFDWKLIASPWQLGPTFSFASSPPRLRQFEWRLVWYESLLWWASHLTVAHTHKHLHALTLFHQAYTWKLVKWDLGTETSQCVWASFHEYEANMKFLSFLFDCCYFTSQESIHSSPRSPITIHYSSPTYCITVI